MAIDLFSIGKLTIHGYGLMIALGFLFALIYGTIQCKKKGLDDDFFFNLALFLYLVGLAEKSCSLSLSSRNFLYLR